MVRLEPNEGVRLARPCGRCVKRRGATRFIEEGLKIGRLIYFGTDPGHHEIAFSKGDEAIRNLVAEHHDCVTYGENIGNADCAIPPLPNLRSKTRQPVLLHLWQNSKASKKGFTTVGNWKQAGRDIEFNAEIYYWSKHHEFLKFLDLPQRIDQSIELATGLANLGIDESRLLEHNGWRLVDAHPLTLDIWPYRDCIRSSRGEFTVAKDLNVRLRSGWFSERSACYLAAGRPVITQDTGFSDFLPRVRAFSHSRPWKRSSPPFDAIKSDYEKHRRAARAIAEEYFRAETVLANVLRDLGL